MPFNEYTKWDGSQQFLPQSAEKAFEFGRSAIDLRSLQEHLVPIILRNPEIRRLTRASTQGEGPIRIVPR